jgi:hypothetical protein
MTLFWNITIYTGYTISNNHGEKKEKLWTNDDMVENLSLETPSGFTITFTIYYNDLI